MEVASPLTTLPVGLSPGGGGGDASNMMVGHHHHHHHHHHHLSNKRSLSSYCGSPTQHQSALANDLGGNIFGTLRDSTTDDIDSDDNDQNHPYHQGRTSKRRRFYEPSEIDSLSRDFSSHTLFFNGSTANKQLQQKQPQQPQQLQPTQQQSNKSIFSTNGASSTLKRVRMAQFATIRAASPSRSPTPEEQQLHQQQQQQDTVLIKKNQELERVIQEQASLIESLQNDKVDMDKSLTSLKMDHERIMKDNSILRKAVAIQEERRIHFEQEMKSSKLQSDEKIRSLEQMIMTLRYHLQAASRSNTNDFIHGPRPPDVY